MDKAINKHEQECFKILIGITEDRYQLLREHRFHATRRWRFDFAYPELMTAIEVEGGTWVGGRHIHPVGFQNDCEKYNAAAKLGWKVYRLTPKFITKDYLKELLS